MKIRVAIAGDLPESSQLFGRVDLIFGEIRGYMTRRSDDAVIQLVSNASYTGKGWFAWNHTHSFPVLAFDPQDAAVASRRFYCEGMCNVSDVAVVAWNEDPQELSGSVWEFIQTAYDRGMPCIWISTNTSNVYCLWSSFYEEYSSRYLEEMLTPLPDQEMRATSFSEPVGPLHARWMQRRSRFLKKYKASNAIHEATDDVLITDATIDEQEVTEDEDIRRILLEKFNEFDESAIEFNSRFQARLYQRSVLPFVTTLFLALGFYAESILGKPLSGSFPSITLIAAFLAGVGFLVHACLNLYVYRLSRREKTLEEQKSFISNRYTAEVLRVMLHFMPYGIFLNIRSLCSENAELKTQLMHIVDAEDDVHLNTKEHVARYALRQARGLLKDQLSYHEASALRYEAIVKRLEMWGRTILYVGFVMVLVRGLMQFLLILFPVSSPDGGMDLNGWLRSFLNMLALVLPAWASYFTAKLTLNNFKFNYNNHVQMCSRIQTLMNNLDRLLKQSTVSVEMASKFSEEVAQTLINQDTSEWARQYLNSTIKPM